MNLQQRAMNCINSCGGWSSGIPSQSWSVIGGHKATKWGYTDVMGVHNTTCKIHLTLLSGVILGGSNCSSARPAKKWTITYHRVALMKPATRVSRIWWCKIVWRVPRLKKIQKYINVLYLIKGDEIYLETLLLCLTVQPVPSIPRHLLSRFVCPVVCLPLF